MAFPPANTDNSIATLCLILNNFCKIRDINPEEVDILDFVFAFVFGGILCAIGQIIIDKTSITPAKLLTGYVCIGVFLSLAGIYDKFVQFAGAGATVPLTGFGHSLFQGVKKAVDENGMLGVFTGGLTATSGGITAAVVFAVITALITKPRMKL